MGESKPADNDVNELVERLKPDIIKKVCESVEGNCPSTDSEIVVKTYKTQTVAGTNYFIRSVELLSFPFRSFANDLKIFAEYCLKIYYMM